MRTAKLAAALLLLWPLAPVAAAEGRWQQIEGTADCVVWNAHPQEDETVTWSGACEAGRAVGYGEQVWRFTRDGKRGRERYVGSMRAGKAHGRGTIEMSDGDRYDGEWQDNRQHGRGVYVFANGDRYEGEFKDGVYHGRGELTFTSGERYDGDFQDGSFHGSGTIVLGNGNSYEGEFAHGTLHGYGVFLFTNGDQCAGEWREGRLLGTGAAVVNGKRRKCYLDGSTVKYTD